MNNKSSAEYHTVRGYQMANQQKKELTAAMEDYLEMAFKLCLENGYTRVGKLSQNLNVRPSSASKMISSLVQLGFLKYDPYESICLTDKGKKTGAYLLYRHNTVEKFLRLVGNTNPLEETELVEHSLHPSTISKINVLLDFFAENPNIKKQYDNFKSTAAHISIDRG